MAWGIWESFCSSGFGKREFDPWWQCQIKEVARMSWIESKVHWIIVNLLLPITTCHFRAIPGWTFAICPAHTWVHAWSDDTWNANSTTRFLLFIPRTCKVWNRVFCDQIFGIEELIVTAGAKRIVKTLLGMNMICWRVRKCWLEGRTFNLLVLGDSHLNSLRFWNGSLTEIGKIEI